MTLALSATPPAAAPSSILLRCAACKFERMAMPSDVDRPESQARPSQAAPVQKVQPRREVDPFLGMPMPRPRVAR